MAMKLDPLEEHHRIASPLNGMRLFLRSLSPSSRRADGEHIVLYIHGATFPSALSIAHRFDGYSWRDALCAAGFEVWGLDFHGFGESDRYPEMNDPAAAHPGLGRADIASKQINAAARYILEHSGAERISIIAHSWGTMPAARFAGENPSLVDRMVLFGPVCSRTPQLRTEQPTMPVWRVITLEDQWNRFVEDVPKDEKPVLSLAHFEDWSRHYLDSDPNSRRRDPVGVKVPLGPIVDLLDAWQGNFAYDPAIVQAPTAIIRGAWDSVTPDVDAGWLFDSLKSSPIKRDIKISHATHLMHLEAMRYALYRESITFLKGEIQHHPAEVADIVP